MKLVQKKLFKGTREVEILGATINFRSKNLVNEKQLTVDLSMLNPEPKVNTPFLQFHSRVTGDALLSLWIDKPTSLEFNAFVDNLKQRAREEYNAFAGLRIDSLPEAMARNVFDEPPEFDEPGQNRPGKLLKPVNVESLDSSISMLTQYLDTEQIGPFLEALEMLRADPENASYLRQIASSFEGLGPRQGAVLTYAPYVGLLLSDDAFESG